MLEEKGRKLEEGVNSRGGITLIKQGSCYRVYRHVGLGARKPVSFLGLAGSLVARVVHPVWHPGSDEAQTKEGQGYRNKIPEQNQVQVFFGEPSLCFTNNENLKWKVNIILSLKLSN